MVTKPGEIVNDDEIQEELPLEAEGTEPEVVNKPKVQTVRESIVSALAEQKEKTPSEDPASGDKTKPAAAKDPKAKPEAKPAAVDKPVANEAPAAWSKEAKATWGQIPPLAQQAILKREVDGTNGVQAIKAKYTELDTVIAPFRESIKQFRLPDGKPVSEAQAVQQLFQWQAWLASPDKANAFKALAVSHGFDISTLAGTSAQPGASAVPPDFQRALDDLAQKVNGFEAASTQQIATSAQQAVTTWAKGKDHFETVRKLMSQLGESGVVPLLPSGHVDLDALYTAACKIHPEVSLLVAEEESGQKARDAAAAKARRAAAAKAAGSSIRPSAPTATAPAAATPKVESVRDSIRRAFAETRQ